MLNRSTLFLTLMACFPLSAHAHNMNHNATEPDNSFTPAPASATLPEVMKACVSDQDIEKAELLSGLGGTRYALVAMNQPEQVQAFYSQGMALQYGFNFSEAIRAFHQASQFDNGSAMPYWGIALSANSNINSDATRGCNILAYKAAGMALENANKRLADPTARERFGERQLQREVDYAKAFLTQYQESAGKVSLSKEGNERYAKAMKTLADSYFDDLDASTLYADALLNISPWKWWEGSEAISDEVKPTTAAYEALQVLNRVLGQDQLHSGANHFYIHAIEESPFPDSGLPMADRFRTLNPAVGHLIHMASHIYQRTGNNALASATNYSAVSVDRAYAHQAQPQSPYALHYLGHNMHFLTWTLSIEGRRNEAMNMAEELVENTTRYSAMEFLCQQYPQEIKTKSDYFYAVPYYYAVRFQDWDALARITPKIDAGLAQINEVCAKANSDWKPLNKPYTRIMAAYATAYQQLAVGGLSNAVALNALKGFWLKVDSVLGEGELAYGNNPAEQLLRIANLILFNQAQQATGEKLPLADVQRSSADVLAGDRSTLLAADLKALDGDNPAQVLAAWYKGVEVQDSLNYNEPPDWYYTLRESLGYAYLAQGKAMEAEKVFSQDLSENRLSGRSLNGLKLSLQQQPGKVVPARVEQELQTAWRNATVSPQP